MCVRLEWPKDYPFPPHTLRFRDGWEPPVLVSREQEVVQLAEALIQTEVQRPAAITVSWISTHKSKHNHSWRSKLFLCCVVLCCDSSQRFRISPAQMGMTSETLHTSVCSCWSQTEQWRLLSRRSAVKWIGTPDRVQMSSGLWRTVSSSRFILMFWSVGFWVFSLDSDEIFSVQSALDDQSFSFFRVLFLLWSLRRSSTAAALNYSIDLTSYYIITRFRKSRKHCVCVFK